MTRLQRVLTLLERYDGLAAAGVGSHDSEFGRLLLKELREEKDKLTQELTEHGCRRER
jgi:hypothetical protein